MWPKNGPKVRHFGRLFVPLTSYDCGVKRNQISFVKRNLEKSRHGALPIGKMKGSMSGFFQTPLNKGVLIYFDTTYFCSQHQISLFLRTSCRFFSKSIHFGIPKFYIGRKLMVSKIWTMYSTADYVNLRLLYGSSHKNGQNERTFFCFAYGGQSQHLYEV